MSDEKREAKVGIQKPETTEPEIKQHDVWSYKGAHKDTIIIIDINKHAKESTVVVENPETGAQYGVPRSTFQSGDYVLEAVSTTYEAAKQYALNPPLKIEYNDADSNAEDTTEYLNSSPENAARLQESIEQLRREGVFLGTEPEYSQKDVVEILHRVEEAAAAQFVAIMQGFQGNMDNFATNIQVQFDLARYSVGCPVSELTQQFLDSAAKSPFEAASPTEESTNEATEA